MLNMLRIVLFVLLMACTAAAQVTFPESFMPLMPSAAPIAVVSDLKGPDPTPIACGSIVTTSVSFSDHALLSYTHSWPPAPDWETWPDEDREIYLDELAYDALFTSPVALAFYMARWADLAESMSMRGFVCNPCPNELSTECLISSAVALGAPVAPEDIRVRSVADLSGMLLISVDFTLHYDAWVTCDTKEGCR